MNDLLVLLLLVVIAYICVKIWKYVLHPYIVEKTTYEVEKNPKWITPKLRQKYYGFSNIDIITVRSPIGSLPRFRLGKDEKGAQRLELLIPEDTSINDIDKVATLALNGKLHIFYNLYFPDKSTQWLAILVYMLDGGEINEVATSFEEKGS